jgi:hypothetical protein
LSNPIELADRYVAVWNEPDSEARRAAVAELWTADGVHILQPGLEVLKSAAGLGMTAAFEARGHDALAERIRIAHEEFIATGKFVFRRRNDVVQLRDVVKFTWEMVPPGSDDVAGVGMEILVLEGSGRILADYQFIER